MGHHDHKGLKNMGLALATTLAIGFGPVAGFAAEFKMKLGTATVNDVQTFAIEQLASRIAERSEGRIETETYPAAQLGSNARMIEGLQLGTLELYIGPSAYLGGVDPRFQVADAPGIFQSYEHMQKVFSDPDFRSRYLALAEDKGLVGIALFTYGPTAFATNKPVTKLSDFDGLKLRVLGSKIEREAAAKMGATAVPIDFSEVVSSLQQNAIDGMKSGMPAFTSLSLFNIVKDVTLTNEAVLSEVAMVSKVWWDKLPADLQAIILEEAQALEPVLYQYVLDAQQKSFDKWEAEGGTLHKLSDADQAEMMSRLSTVASDVLGEGATAEMFQLVLDTAKRNE